MPVAYERIRDRLISKGMSEKEAKTRAAKIYNSLVNKGKIKGKHVGGRHKD